MLESHPVYHLLTELRTWCVDYKTWNLVLQGVAWNEDVQLWRTPNGILLAPSDTMPFGTKCERTSFNRLRGISVADAAGVAGVADVAKLGIPLVCLVSNVGRLVRPLIFFELGSYHS